VTAQGPICSICYRRSREHQCVQCGRVTVEARLADPEARTWICNRCWVPPSMMCTDCGQVKPCGRGGASGRPICSTCRARRRRPRTCAVCARDVVTQTTLPLGPVCGPCYRRIRRNPNDCATCGETRPLVGFNAAGGGVCGPCCSDERTWICRGCGRVDLLIADTLCLACTVKDRVNHLLTGPDGRISAQLHGVEALLLVDHTAEQTQVILNSCRWIRLLARLVAHGEPITHNALDRLEQTMHVRHLRHVLVDTGALEKRADGMEGLEPWLKGLLAGLPPRTATVLQRYVSWSLLPRTRRRATRGRTTVSSPRYVRTQILAAHQFLMWLETNQIGLAETTQHDVDTWLRRGASTRRRVRDFLRWAHDRGLADELEVGWLGRQGLPEQILDNDQRWTLLRRCLRDDSLPLRLRIAGALVLLYGQIPSRIVRLTTDGITTNEKGTYLALRKQPVLLPPLLAALITELVSANSAYWSKTSRIDSPAWLFPGTRAGSHLGSGRLTLLLNQEIGVFVRPARGAALSDLAGNLPAPILADLLGISVAAAGRWRAIAGSDDADYLAARTVTPPVANSLAW